MSTNLTRPMRKPWAISGMTCAEGKGWRLESGQFDSTVVLFDRRAAVGAHAQRHHMLLSAGEPPRLHSTQPNSQYSPSLGMMQLRTYNARTRAPLMVVHPALSSPLMPSVVNAVLMTSPQKGATSSLQSVVLMSADDGQE